MNRRSLAILLPLLMATLHAQTVRASRCQAITLTAELSAGDRFEEPIGSALVFQLDPARLGPNGELSGWEMKITTAAAAPDDDYIYPVTPPLRFNGVQTLGPSYGDDAKKSLSYPHEVRFLLRRSDYDRIVPLLTNALWPCQAPNPDKAGPEYLAALEKTPAGWLKLTVLSYALAPGTDLIRHIKFRADFVAPKDFIFLSELRPESATCPRN